MHNNNNGESSSIDHPPPISLYCIECSDKLLKYEEQIVELERVNFIQSAKIVQIESECELLKQRLSLQNKSTLNEAINTTNEISICLPAKSLMFIPEECTKYAIKNDKDISLYFQNDSKLLFHFLKWSIKLQSIDSFYRVFYVNNNKDIIIFNSELKKISTNDGILYIVGIKNDKELQKSATWKMDKFMTGTEILDEYKIKDEDLPKGSRSDGHANYQCLDIKGLIKDNDMKKYANLRIIKTKSNKEKHKMDAKERYIHLVDLYKCINAAIKSDDDDYNIIPIIDFDKKKMNYYVDILLPVELDENNWIGIVYRDNIPISICIDWYDIRNKAVLFDPMCHSLQNKWYTNNITKLRVDCIKKR